MLRSEFAYDLPDELIARYPCERRCGSRLLHLDGDVGAIADRDFTDLPALLRPGDLLVFNDTRVLPARLHGAKDSGGRIELLLERVIDAHRVLAQLRASKPPRPGSGLTLAGGHRAVVAGRRDEFWEVRFEDQALQVFERHGEIPLPPYLHRAAEAIDRERYQTVYAQRAGAVAAPTAGLHFDEPLLASLREKGVESTFVTLHVGAGTFQPVRVERIEDHHMHREWLEVGQSVVDAVAACRARGGRVIAVGTTSVRSLESAARDGELRAFSGDTDIFLYPGKSFHVVDALVTNFHLPESTLLMLVSAFAGYTETMAAYAAAVAEGYRFFSYGDAMFITRNPAARGPEVSQ